MNDNFIEMEKMKQNLTQKKKMHGFGRESKACGNWMIKIKPVITAVTRVLSNMLAVCLTELGIP